MMMFSKCRFNIFATLIIALSAAVKCDPTGDRFGESGGHVMVPPDSGSFGSDRIAKVCGFHDAGVFVEAEEPALEFGGKGDAHGEFEVPFVVRPGC